MNIYEKILMGIGGVFIGFLLLSELFSETFALWTLRVFILVGLAWLFFFFAGIPWAWVQSKLKTARFQSELKRAEIEKAYMQAKYDIVNHNGQMLYVGGQKGDLHHFANIPIEHRGAKTAPAIDPPPEPKKLLPQISGFDRLLVIGGQGSGKTSLLLHLVEDRAQDSHLIICDSHAAPDSWPHNVQIAGAGRNYPEIQATINYVCEELDRRYSLRSSGRQKKFDRLALIVDEGFVLNQFLDIKDQMKSLLAEGRKVNIGIIFAGHSDRAGALGLSGNKDLLNGYERIVFLETRRDETTGKNVPAYAVVKKSLTDKDGVICDHPGVYRRLWAQGTPGTPYTDRTPENRKKWPPEGGNGGNGRSSEECAGQLVYDRDAGEYIVEPNRQQEIHEVADGRTAKILRAFKSGMGITDISRTAFNGTKGGKQNRIIRDILSGFGLQI